MAPDSTPEQGFQNFSAPTPAPSWPFFFYGSNSGFFVFKTSQLRLRLRAGHFSFMAPTPAPFDQNFAGSAPN